ncbi:MAG: HlyD family efflux transporter periplasmic adaptor subunit [Cyclobacteriaceae bacterium]|nr:HlyD family efflux transporter periplasmic adaptor subunit [Cyclobacteriaceae bacterium]
MRIIFLLTGSLLLSCSRNVEKTSPVVGPISESVYASGVIKSKGQYQVYTSVAGLVHEILVNEGDTVRKGSPIMRLLNEPSRLQALNAKYAADYADLKANSNKLGEAKAQVELARSKLKNDSLLFERQQNLWKQGVGSRIDFEQRELSYKNSKASYESATVRYEDLKRQLEFTSKQATTNLRISSAQAADYLVKSEIDGKVFKILKEQGEFANTLNPVAVIGDANDFLLEMKIDEYDIAQIHKGQKIVYSMDSYKGQVFEARVDNIEPIMDEPSRSFTVEGKFVTRPPVLYPHLSAEANIILRSQEKALTIPRNYLMNDSMVLLSNGRLKKVVVGLKDYQRAEIREGLTAEDVIYKPNL